MDVLGKLKKSISWSRKQRNQIKELQIVFDPFFQALVNAIYMLYPLRHAFPVQLKSITGMHHMAGFPESSVSDKKHTIQEAILPQRQKSVAARQSAGRHG